MINEKEFMDKIKESDENLSLKDIKKMSKELLYK